MEKITLYVGLNDSATLEQRFDTEKYVSVIKNICRSYKAPFSLNYIRGGYFGDDGTFVDENSLEISFLAEDDETVDEIAKDICAFFHQESVLIVKQECEIRYVHESL